MSIILDTKKLIKCNLKLLTKAKDGDKMNLKVEVIFDLIGKEYFTV